MATECLGPARDIIEMIIVFLGTQDYLSVASVSTQWRNAWGQQPAVTSRRWAVQSRSCLDWASACGLEIWDGPCLFAAGEGRLDVLQHAVALGYSREGMPTCEWAAAGGHLEVVKWCRANGYRWGWSSFRAAEGGHLEVVKWCVANGCPTNMLQIRLPRVPRGHYRGKQTHRLDGVFEVFDAAAWGGHLETAMWCKDQGYEWSCKTSRMAVEGGHMDVLRWLVTNGCPWGQETMETAARAGYLGILEWCNANACPWDDSVVIGAAEGGNLEVVKWCVANAPHDRSRIDAHALVTAAGRGHLEVVQWTRANGCQWRDQVCYVAACGDHLEVLKWCLENGCPWGFPRRTKNDTFNGSVTTIMWAASNGCPWIATKHFTDVMYKHAARGGNLEVLQWCTTYQPLPILEVSLEAALKGQVHILEWLRATGRLSDGCVDSSLCKRAAHSGSIDMVKWCRANGSLRDSPTIEDAMQSGNLELVQWCRTHGYPWGTTPLLVAAISDDIEAVAWCLANGCPLDVSSINILVPNVPNTYVEMNKWCRDNLPR